MKVVFLNAATLPRRLAFDAGLDIVYESHAATSDAEIAQRVAGASVVIVNKVRLDGDLIRSLPDLELIAVAAAGTDNIDVATARGLGIRVRNVPDYGSDAVAEHAIASLFAMRQHLMTYAAAATDGRWAASPHFLLDRSHDRGPGRLALRRGRP